ncbi:MAG: YceI family protein [Bacteroidota bacterium]
MMNIANILIMIAMISAGVPGKGSLADECGNSNIKIEGQALLRSFELHYDFNGKRLSFYDPPSLSSVQENNTVSIPVAGFRASSPELEEDFRDLVKADRFPEITISFTGKDFTEERMSTFRLGLTIAGITNYYDVLCKIQPLDKNLYCISGSKELSIQDFSLEPPSIIPGLIEVSDRINIFFSINFETIT